jgi:transcriptional regulator with XRE-family HTH domain
MLDRIQLLIKSKNLTASKFADEIGVQRSGISHILSGRNKPSLEFIQKILSRFPEIRMEWLLNGAGQMNKDLQLFHTDILTPDELNKIEKNTLNDDMLDSQEVMNDSKADTQFSIPLSPTLNKSIEKIVVFYSDKTFSEYKPEK